MAKCIICGKQESSMYCICGSCLPGQPKALREYDPKKVVPRKALDALIKATKAYNGSVVRNDMHKKLADINGARKEIEAQTDYSIGWAVQHFVDALCGVYGMMPDATNEEIYMLLKMIGWEVVDHD